METMRRGVAPPVRREEILRLAESIREQYDPSDIELVAREREIVLVRTSGGVGREAGFAFIEFTRRPRYLESLSHPEEPLRVWGEDIREPVRSIVINMNSGIPDREIFWHEYYHLFHSPHAIQRSERFEHHFSTEGVLHTQEERRADEFAAAILIPSLVGCATIADICERFDVSERLARHAIKLYRNG